MNIKLDHVSKKLKHATVVNDVTMEILPGTITGLSGINGSGKTMLMRIICGLIFPTSGQVQLGDKILGKDISFPESIGILIENPAFLDSYSGFQNLQIIASIKDKIGDDDIRAILEKVGLNPDDKKKYRKYSLGMKQRLGIAAALMEKPDIIILDEPTNALDADGIEMLKSLLPAERDRGANIILSCHDKSILQELADEIYYLKDGAVIGYEKLEG